MFGSADNIGKFAELIGNPEFADIAEKLCKLMKDNQDSFASME